VSDKARPARIECPYRPPEEYDFRISFTRLGGDSFVGQVLSKRALNLMWAMGGMGKGGIDYCGGFLETTDTTVNLSLQNNRRYTALVSVRNGSLTAYLDGQLLIRWDTNFSTLDMVTAYRMRDPTLLGLITLSSPTVFHSAEVLEVTGRGSFTRPADPTARAAEKKRIAERGDAVLDLGGGVEMALVLVPAGEFVRSDGKGAYRVRLKKPFFIGRYEVTQAEYERITGKNPSKWRDAGLPVEQVTWEDAKAFCEAMSRTTGRTVRLPTEAEWEYACRAGTRTAYCSGADVNALNTVGWWSGNADGKTHATGQKQSNAWGIYDMHGNVQEWCGDNWGGDYAKMPLDDPVGPRGSGSHILRGGGWYMWPEMANSGVRDGLGPGNKLEGIGFRVVVDATADEAAKSVAIERPWMPLFDGKTLDCLAKQGEGEWKVEDGALMNAARDSKPVMTALALDDAEIRIRFAATRGAYVSFKARWTSDGKYTVGLTQDAALADKPQELIFDCRGENVTAILNGTPAKLEVSGRPRKGFIQLYASGGTLRVFSIEYRAPRANGGQ
jgi:formylglycine-generating enzyme required for sulfatase activity